ncbi:dihydrolipoyl dehydrogenase family protein [Halopenitus persicus]|uniref:Dihydrolipoamide dehydrogenase n=1 Tax=Halopenitus persicus TaxID=1048396 RepID=A0A1H3IEW7_9EURY|nr:NAD(P)/FAD-dependent oxidoreductase [Halopenitus persicus]SDY26127.1 dihydrolipoamide dehydrogenase [Halopenitus persicus]
MHVVVIGAYGSAGAAVAEGLAPAVGTRVDQLTLIDDGEPGGGLCILEGCMPSKELLSAAAHRFQGRVDDRLTGEPHELDLERIVAEKNDRTRGWAGHRRESIHEIADDENAEFIHAPATFVDDHTIEVDGRTIEADYVVIATGSVPNVPDIPGLEAAGYHTSKDLLHATELPESAVLLGFGYVGLEMAPYLAEAGVDLTVIEHDERPIDEADPEFGDALLEIYREEFDIEIRTEVYEERVVETDDGVRLDLVDADGNRGPDPVAAEEIFCFTGRVPNLDRLGLEHTSLSPDDDWIDATMRPPNADRTFVVGDANGREPILHVAKEQGYQTAENILSHARGEPIEPYGNVHHHVIFSGAAVYPFARVGHTPRSAVENGHSIVTATRQASDDGVFKSKDAPHGLARLVVDADDGTVLGWQGLHYHADVMAKTLQLAVEMELDVREIPDRAYHPTTPEILDGLIRECAADVANGEE